MRSDRAFAVLILTHGRPDRVWTHATLRKHGYTGRIVLVIDDMDKTGEQYRAAFGDDVVMFDKRAAAGITDAMDNLGNMKAVVYARNVTWDIARNLGLTHFLVLDDDYNRFGYVFGPSFRYLDKGPITKRLDRLFNLTLDYLDETSITCLAWAQGGDFIGGGENSLLSDGLKPHRKLMNTFFCRTDRRFDFSGTINEDTTAYVMHGAKGVLFLTYLGLRVWQHETQTNAGGLTDIYLQLGTYVKSFYTVMAAPSCCVVRQMGTTHPRLHHGVSWRHAVPKVVSEALRKPDAPLASGPEEIDQHHGGAQAESETIAQAGAPRAP